MVTKSMEEIYLVLQVKKIKIHLKLQRETKGIVAIENITTSTH